MAIVDADMSDAVDYVYPVKIGEQRLNSLVYIGLGVVDFVVIKKIYMSYLM